MIERAFRHCSLTAHFLILAALYYYFKNKGRTDFKAVIPFFIINALAITIHPYFLPFTFGIMFAFCIENFFLYKKYISVPSYVVSSVVLTLLVGYIIGAFYVGDSMSNIGYGLYNMNLNAFFNPISQGFDNWSAILEIKPNFSYPSAEKTWYGQIEGFNYLGLGVLLFIPVSAAILITLRRKQIFKDLISFIKTYFGIIISVGALTIFALGDWITYGGLRIFRLPIPGSIINGVFGIFRANGRFGWLLSYFIVGFVLYIIITLTPKKLATVLLTILMIIQIYDMRGLLLEKKMYFTDVDSYSGSQKVATILKSSFWDYAADKFDCVYRAYAPVDNKCIEIAQKFAKKGKKVNTAFEARVDQKTFADLSSALYDNIINGKLENKEIVLFIECDEQLINSAKNNEYTIIFVDNIYAIFNNIFTTEELTIINEENSVEFI